MASNSNGEGPSRQLESQQLDRSSKCCFCRDLTSVGLKYRCHLCERPGLHHDELTAAAILQTMNEISRRDTNDEQLPVDRGSQQRQERLRRMGTVTLPSFSWTSSYEDRPDSPPLVRPPLSPPTQGGDRSLLPRVGYLPPPQLEDRLPPWVQFPLALPSPPRTQYRSPPRRRPVRQTLQMPLPRAPFQVLPPPVIRAPLPPASVQARPPLPSIQVRPSYPPIYIPTAESDDSDSDTCCGSPDDTEVQEP